MTKRLGKIIKLHRVKQDLTTGKLADMAETSQGYLSEIERGNTNASIALLSKIAVALGFPLWQLIKEAEETEEKEGE